jgi:hypothetical protein
MPKKKKSSIFKMDQCPFFFKKAGDPHKEAGKG